MPERQQRGRPDALVGDQVAEGFQVVFFLRLHVTQQVALVAPAKHGKLAGIDARRAILPGVIDTDHALGVLPGTEVPWPPDTGSANASFVNV